MDLSNKTISQAYNPFWRLSFYNAFIYSLWMVMFCVFLGVIINIVNAQGKYPWDVALAVYFILCIKAFGISILSIFERKKYCFAKALVKISVIETDGLFGDYKNANREIRMCYPDKFEAERKKLVCIDKSKKKLKFRIIGSRKKMQTIKNEIQLKEKDVYITYGRLTKIILRFEIDNPQKNNNYILKLLNDTF